MADNTVITSGPGKAGSNSQGNSPWDDDLPEEAKQPMIVGNLDSSHKSSGQGETQPVPFNIPKNVIEEKDNAKIAAQKVANTPAPQAAPKTVAETRENQSAPAGVAALIKPQAANSTGPTIIHPSTSSSVGGDIRQAQNNNPVRSNQDAGPSVVAQAVAPSTSNISTASKGEAPVKQGLFSKLNFLNKKSAKFPSVSPPKEDLRQSKDQTSYKQFKLNKIVYIIAGVVIILFVGVYLTEAGIASFGLEKIYGSVGLEGLWGGLSKSPDKALAEGVASFQTNLNFKVKGKISIDASKGSSSDIVGPLLSLANFPMALKDTSSGLRDIAVLAATDTTSTPSTDYYGIDSGTDTTDITGTSDISGSDYLGTDNLNSDYSGSDSSTAADSSSSLDATSGSSTTAYPQNTEPAYQTDASASKTIDADIKAISTENGVSTDITINKIVGTQDKIQLVANQSDLYVKSDPTVKFAENYQQNKWLDFKLKTTQNDNVFTDLSLIKADSGLAVVGSRVSNEKVGTIRCYRYNITNLELGDSLKDLGIDSSYVQKISGDVWIGISDKLIHKINLTIIPSSASSVTKIGIQFEFYDYGVKNSIALPSSSDRISPTPGVATDVLSDGTTGSSATGNATLTPSTGDSNNGSAINSNDTIRKSDLAKIKAALVQYKAVYGRYPISESYDRSNSQASILKAALVPTYLTALPSDPLVSSGWWYGYQSSNGVSYTLSAQIENASDPETTVVSGIRLYYLKND